MNNMRRSDNATKRRMGGGFTLSEVLVAMAIFLVGFIAVASLFPAAAYIQKQTVDDIEVEYFEESVRSMLSAMKFRQSDLETIAGIDTDGLVHALEYAPVGSTNLGFGSLANPRWWSLRDRSHMSINETAEESSLYFVPMVRDANPEVDVFEWQVFAFIVQRRPGASFPVTSGANYNDPDPVPNVLSKGASAAAGSSTITLTNDAGGGDFIHNIGDYLLDNNGFIYRVTDADAGSVEINSFIIEEPNALNTIWFGAKGGASRTSTRKIIILTDAVDTEQ